MSIRNADERDETAENIVFRELSKYNLFASGGVGLRLVIFNTF